jgi:dephospho-CoA kinase
MDDGRWQGEDARMKIVGLTGGIASGKSTVGRLLAARGVPVVDADMLARAAVSPGTPGLAAIQDRFGAQVLLPDGTLDRAALAGVVFADDAARKELNGIVHPAVAALAVDRLQALAQAGHGVAVYEVPLLFENGLEQGMDHTILVACAEEEQVARVQARDGLPAAAARARIAAQMPLSEKRGRASVVIENDGPPDALPDQVEAAWAALGLTFPG